MPGGLGSSADIENTPSRSRHDILESEDQRAVARRTRPSPFGESRFHHLAGDGPRQIEIAVEIALPERQRIDAIEVAKIVVAHVLEVPVGTGIAGNAGLAAGKSIRLRKIGKGQ